MIKQLLKYICFLGIGSASLEASYYIGQKNFIKPKYAYSFQHLDYVNPEAPKGGTVRLKAGNRTFTTFYPYAFKHVAAEVNSLLYASLCKAPADELTVAYAYAAQEINIEPTKGLVTFTLRPHITFENGQPITSKDVIYSFEFARQYGTPHLQEALRKGVTFKALDPHKIQVYIEPFSQELAFLISKIPIIPYGTKKAETPLSSGPYRVQSYKLGYRVVYEKVKNWWGDSLPINIGQHNFNQIEYLYFANFNSGFEGFKKHLYDIRVEPKILVWNRQYNFSSMQEGKVIRKEIPKPVVHNLSMLVLNVKRQPLNDWRVRKALGLFFNFERINKVFFEEHYYHQLASIFTNNGFAASPKMTSAEEKILAPFKAQLPAGIWIDELKLVHHDSWQTTRALWREAYKLLEDAGWTLEQGTLRHKETGKIFQLEIVLSVPEFTKHLQDYVQTLRKFGMRVHIVFLDSTQYIHRVRNEAYDIIIEQVTTSTVPGYEQKGLWSRFQDPVVNVLTENLARAKTLNEVKIYAAALDRVIQSQNYIIFGWSMDDIRIAYYNNLAHPDTAMGLFDPFAWWALK